MVVKDLNKTQQKFFLQKIKFDSTQIIQKYCLFLLKFDLFRSPAIFQCRKTEMIKLLTKFHNFKPWMRQPSHNKCAEVTHWLKKHVCILREFSIFPGRFKSNRFVVEVGSMGVKLPPCYLRATWILFSANWMFRLLENHLV